MAFVFAAPAIAVECYPEAKVKADLDSKGYTLHRSTTADKLELFAYTSGQEKRWLIFAKPPSEQVQGAPTNESMLCPLDADEGDVAALEASPYFQKYFQAAAPAAAPAQ
jgi:hypothetical protein